MSERFKGYSGVNYPPTVSPIHNRLLWSHIMQRHLLYDSLFTRASQEHFRAGIVIQVSLWSVHYLVLWPPLFSTHISINFPPFFCLNFPSCSLRQRFEYSIIEISNEYWIIAFKCMQVPKYSLELPMMSLGLSARAEQHFCSVHYQSWSLSGVNLCKFVHSCVHVPACVWAFMLLRCLGGRRATN